MAFLRTVKLAGPPLLQIVVLLQRLELLLQDRCCFHRGEDTGEPAVDPEACQLVPRRLADPQGWNYVVCESTYGDRDRIDTTDEMRRRILQAEVNAAARHQDGALIIPSFAVERTQELLADLVFLIEQKKIPECPVIIDSPLATRATEIFKSHSGDLDNGDLLERAIRSRFVRFTESVEQSKALDFVKGFHIVIAASGMCEAGRIRHRLKNWLWREEGTVLLVGF